MRPAANARLEVMAADILASSLTDLYVSHPLSPESQCIRVVDVCAATDPHSDSGLIEVNFRVIDLEKQPSFTALSYVWGIDDPAQALTVTCGDFRIPVTSNCHSALRHLRNKLGAFTIWVDAICINQESSDEKAQQIPLMNRIYADAQAVYLWLGEGNRIESPNNVHTDRAMRYLGNAGKVKYFSESGDGIPAASSPPRPFAASLSVYTSRWSLTRHCYLFEGTATGWRVPAFMRIRRFKESTIWATYDDLEELLSRDWIRRIWTYQEILLASNPIVVCGNAHLPWSRFELSIIFLEDTGVNYDDIVIPKIQALKAWKRIAFSRERLQQDLTNPPLRSPFFAGRTRLQEYQQFVHGIVGYRNDFLTWLYPLFAVVCLTFLTFVALTAVKYHYPAVSISISKSACVAILVIFGILAICGSVDRIRRDLCHQPATRAPVEATFTDDLIDGLATRRAREPKDMAFGVRAILQKRSNVDLPPPDYSKPTAEVYKELTSQLITMTGSLQLLVLAALESFTGQPSWIPDWSCNLHQRWPDLDVHISDFHEFRNEGEMKRARKSTRQVWHGILEPTSTILYVEARRLCTVTSLFAFEVAQNSTFDVADPVHRQNLDAIINLHRLYTGMKSFPHFLSRLFRIAWPQVLGSAKLASWAHFIKSHLEHSVDDIALLLQNKDTATFRFNLFQRTTVGNICATHIEICNLIANVGRVAFTGDDQRPGIGLCSQKAKAGDCVMFVRGASLPLILRQHHPEKHFKLISPAVFADESFSYAKAKGEPGDYEEIALS